MTVSLLIPVAAASLAGSLHCAGMCGGFVTFYAAGSRPEGLGRWAPHLTYHAGRLLTYTTLGASAGALGSALNRAGALVGLAHVAAVAAGITMLATAAALLLGQVGVRLWRTPAWLKGASAMLARLLVQLRERPPILRAALLGLASTLLPCGWLYSFVVMAAGTGSPVSGAAVMLAFWAGTVPLLMGMGLGIQHLGARIQRHVPVVTALVLVGVGLYSVLDRVNISDRALNRLESGLLRQAATRGAGRVVPAAGAADCPCHKHRQ